MTKQILKAVIMTCKSCLWSNYATRLSYKTTDYIYPGRDKIGHVVQLRPWIPCNRLMGMA